MITTITLSPCIDKTLTVKRFDTSNVNRAAFSVSDIGGKGVNVSRSLKRMGVETAALGLNFHGGESVSDILDSEGIPNRFVICEGEIRTNIKIFDCATQNTIEINEQNPEVNQRDIDMLKKEYLKAAERSGYIVLSGSAPPGVSNNIYFELALAAAKVNPSARIVLDASGELLKNGLKASPYMIKPNIFELEAYFSRKLNGKDEIKAACRKIIADCGVKIVLASMGSDGAAIVTEDFCRFMNPPEVAVKSAQGAGDCMVAGAVRALSMGLSEDEILRHAICAAAVSVSKEGTGLCCIEDLNKMLFSLPV